MRLSAPCPKCGNHSLVRYFGRDLTKCEVCAHEVPMSDPRPSDIAGVISFLTAREIEQARLLKKRMIAEAQAAIARAGGVKVHPRILAARAKGANV